MGCLGVVILGILSLYCAGTVSVLVRPILLQLVPTPNISQATLPPAPTPTFTLALFPLPTGTVPRTPTQGRIPTRETAPWTPTLDPSLSPTITVNSTLGSPRASTTPTRSTATPTRR